jgi:hypothetical protein
MQPLPRGHWPRGATTGGTLMAIYGNELGNIIYGGSSPDQILGASLG